MKPKPLQPKFKHIELFAGCGGMSLGLEAAGFDLYMANELSPMAGETFAFNLLGENLSQLAAENKEPEKVLWINSKFDKKDLKKRLRENPLDHADVVHQDISFETNLKDKLLIGNIDHFLKFLARHKGLSKQLRIQDIDLLSGGPPCQGFSFAGKRVKDNYKNLLPLSFARFAGLIQPKVILLENVKGITFPFKDKDGTKLYAWFEVAKAFSIEGFIPVGMLINAKFFGVPQNRPRFILYAFRKDIFEKLRARKDNSKRTNEIFANALFFYNKVRENRKNLEKVKLTDIVLYDIETELELFDGDVLPKPHFIESEFLDAEQAIADIATIDMTYNLAQIQSLYATSLQNNFKSKFASECEELQNHENRQHTYKVKARFRLYQALNNLNGMKQNALQVITGKCNDEQVFQKVFDAFREEKLLLRDGGVEKLEPPETLQFFKDYLKDMESKKHSQKAIKHNEPAPSVMTIPDDLCHYSINQLRTLTVREMARFQSFPDWFVFRSKITTGGQQRKYEVPQYTQVGNAVPPMLAFALGQAINKLLKSIG